MTTRGRKLAAIIPTAPAKKAMPAPKPPATSKKVQLVTRVESAIAERIKFAASKSGLSVADFLRMGALHLMGDEGAYSIKGKSKKGR